MSTFLVRPSNSEKEAFRIKLTASSLLGLKLKPGDLCNLSVVSAADEDSVVPATSLKSAIAWEASGNGMKDTVVQTSKFLQELYGFKLGDKLIITRAPTPLKCAETVTLVNKNDQEPLTDSLKSFWEVYLKFVVKSTHEYLAVSQNFSLPLGGTRGDFEVSDIGFQDVNIARISEDTIFRIGQQSATTFSGIKFVPQGLGGLDLEIQAVQKMIARLLYPRIPIRYQPSQGLLVYGAKGVGKSHLINELSQAGWSFVHRWIPGTKVNLNTTPTLILIDQIDMPSSQTGTKASVRELDRLFSSIQGRPCLIVGEAKHPNDVDSFLRSEGKFSYEIELPIPTAMQRKQILSAMLGTDQFIDEPLLQEMASRTHGYVGADLKALLRRVLELASERIPDTDMDGNTVLVNGNAEGNETDVAWAVELEDLEAGLLQIRPSALQEIFLETPNVRWNDIGGQHEIKKQLQNAVERPLKMADQMKKLALKPKKGVLLYGPPGCSKTLLVRALATEAGLNFLAVKGAELISMYVGESERATREVFRKARAASPSIIFFDEIDAIASRGRSGSDLNVLTTLLNEMDGFEELKNVFVVAATNKPENIDPALMRPGRFDNVVYVGPPDLEARTEILQKQFEMSNYHADATVMEDAQRFAAQTEGFSGAEVVAICQTAAEQALDNSRDYVTADDVRTAVARTPKSITSDILADFRDWNAARMR